MRPASHSTPKEEISCSDRVRERVQRRLRCFGYIQTSSFWRLSPLKTNVAISKSNKGMQRKNTSLGRWASVGLPRVEEYTKIRTVVAARKIILTPRNGW